jgi:GNAT superfamily N-acetyltransferase
MNRALNLFIRLFFDRGRYLFYEYDQNQGIGRVNACIKCYDSWSEIPEHFRKKVAPSPLMNAMYYRILRGDAKLLCYSEDGNKLDAFGWIQDWRTFRIRFGAIAKTGTMLGPFWTAPEARGRGLYGRLLAHSLTCCSKEHPIIIYTSPENKASLHGIENAGFRALGEWDFRMYLQFFSRMRRVS